MSTKTATEQRIPAGTWALDPVHSSVRYEVGHSGVSTFHGGFGAIDATLTGGEEPQLEGSVEVESIEIDQEQLKGHLLSPEFFDAERHPRVSFRSSRVRLADDGELELRGELEIAGTSREVEARGRYTGVATYIDGSERVGLSIETAIDRSDFGMAWQAELPSGGEALAYEVKLVVELELVRQEA